MSEHTPGPWMVLVTEDTKNPPDKRWPPTWEVGQGPQAMHDGIMRNYRSVCILNIDGRQEANARLIVAAPDLLKLCEDWLGGMTPDDRCLYGHDGSLLVTTIAKAKGE